MRKQYIVSLTSDEHAQLVALTRKGKASARQVTRAHVLPDAADALKDVEITASAHTSVPTSGRTGKQGSTPTLTHPLASPSPAAANKSGNWKLTSRTSSSRRGCSATTRRVGSSACWHTRQAAASSHQTRTQRTHGRPSSCRQFGASARLRSRRSRSHDRIGRIVIAKIDDMQGYRSCSTWTGPRDVRSGTSSPIV